MTIGFHFKKKNDFSLSISTSQILKHWILNKYQPLDFIKILEILVWTSKIIISGIEFNQYSQKFWKKYHEMI